MFGYITATIASFFVGQDARAARAESAGQVSTAETAALRHEVAALRAQVATLNRLLETSRAPRPQREEGHPRRAS